MKTLQRAVFLTVSFIIISCGSSERVITSDGTIYNVNGKTIKKDGKEANDDLSASEKEMIYDLVDRKEEIREEEDKNIKALEKAIDEQEQIEKDAKEKQRELKNQLDALNTKIKERQDARDHYVKVKKNYNNEKKQFNKLKKNGKLSAIELKEWEMKLKQLEEEVVKAKSKF